MNRKQLISIFFIALLLGILAVVLFILSPFMQPIFWGAVLAFAFFPFYEKMLMLFKQNRNAAAVIATLLILLCFVPFMVFLLLTAVKEMAHLYSWLSDSVQNGDAERLLRGLSQHPWVQKIENSRLIPWESVQYQLEDWTMNVTDSLGQFMLKSVPRITKNLATGVVNVLLTFFLTFFFFRDGKRIYHFIYTITPLDEDNKQEIFKMLSEAFSATLRGQLFTALVQGAMLGLVFWLMDLPLPVFFMCVTFLAAMIPVFGAATIWMPFVIYLGVTQQTGQAVLLFFLGAFGISGIDNVLKPLLIGQKTKLPYSLLFLGILGGLQVFGLMGIFLAPAFLSLFFVLIKIYNEKFSEHAS